MREEGATAERLAAYSDAVFAVIVTVMVLELKGAAQSASRVPIALCLLAPLGIRRCGQRITTSERLRGLRITASST